tara:strand:- start:3558 stop:4844 length:1287 start_codon:yes stop_codon:yes gene_type:complete
VVAFSTILGLGQLGLSAFGAMSASKAANKSAKQSQALTQAQIDAINRTNEISDAGADALQQALGQVLMELGSRGTYDPAVIDDLANLLAQENREGATETAAAIKQAALQGGGRSNQQLLNALATAQGMFRPTISGMTATLSQLNPNAYDATVAANAKAYAGMLDNQTKDNLNAALSRIVAGRMGKMGGARSGAEIAAATAAAESASRQQSENQLRAINMAMQQAQGLQGLSTGLQAGNINAQKMAMNIADMQFKQAIDSVTAGQTARANAQTLDANQMQQAIAQLTAQDALNQNKDLQAYQTAVNMAGAEQALRSGLLSEVQNLVTAPYTYRMAGPNMAQQTAAGGAKAAAGTTGIFAKEAGSAFNSVGQQLDKLLKQNQVQSPTLSSSAGTGSFIPPSSYTAPSNRTIDPIFGNSPTAGGYFSYPVM